MMTDLIKVELLESTDPLAEIDLINMGLDKYNVALDVLNIKVTDYSVEAMRDLLKSKRGSIRYLAKQALKAKGIAIDTKTYSMIL